MLLYKSVRLAIDSCRRNKQAGIERYAIFGNYDGKADAGNMITGGKLNEVGIAYRDAI